MKRALHRGGSATTTAGADHPVLCRLYPHVLSLRHYLLSRIPASEKNRRRRIAQFGRPTTGHHVPDEQHLDDRVLRLLDEAVVGTVAAPHSSTQDHGQTMRDRDHDIKVFSQQRSQSTNAGTFNPGYFLQSEVCCHRKPHGMPRSLHGDGR